MSGRTLVITNDFPPRPGGIQAFVHGLLLRQDPDSVVVYAPKWKRAAEWDSAQPFPVIRHRTSLMLPEPSVRRTASAIAKEYECDRLFFGAAAPLGMLAGPLKKDGLEHSVALTHGHEAGWAITPGAKRTLRTIGERVTTITYLGEYTRARIAGALSPEAASRMRRLVPGVDEISFNPSNRQAGLELKERYGISGRPTVVCVSRLMPRKGQDTLIGALSRIKAGVPDAALLIVGGGPYRKRLQSMAVKAGVAEDVVFTGSVAWEELPAHYAAGDVFAMPCRTRNGGLDVEGLGIVFLEASASGLPVVAGDSGGAPDAVLEGKTGFVVDGSDDRCVVEPIVRLLQDPELATSLGRQGRAWVESTWLWQHQAHRLAAMLRGEDPDA